MAKEEKSKFQLKKGTDHGFDISKGAKRKFDLTKDVDEPVTPTKPEPTPKPVAVKPTPSPKPEPKAQSVKKEEPIESSVADSTERKGNKAWLWIVVIIIIALLGWWLWPSSNTPDAADESQVEEVITPVDDSVVATEDAGMNDAADEAANVETPSGSTASDNSEAQPALSAQVSEATSASAVANVPSDAAVSSDVEAEALKVIRGDYGDGRERKARLGDRYRAIQDRVNELKRQGAF